MTVYFQNLVTTTKSIAPRCRTAWLDQADDNQADSAAAAAFSGHNDAVDNHPKPLSFLAVKFHHLNRGVLLGYLHCAAILDLNNTVSKVSTKQMKSPPTPLSSSPHGMMCAQQSYDIELIIANGCTHSEAEFGGVVYLCPHVGLAGGDDISHEAVETANGLFIGALLARVVRLVDKLPHQLEASLRVLVHQRHLGKCTPNSPLNHW